MRLGPERRTRLCHGLAVCPRTSQHLSGLSPHLYPKGPFCGAPVQLTYRWYNPPTLLPLHPVICPRAPSSGRLVSLWLAVWGDLLWSRLGITWLTSNCFGQGQRGGTGRTLGRSWEDWWDSVYTLPFSQAQQVTNHLFRFRAHVGKCVEALIQSNLISFYSSLANIY